MSTEGKTPFLRLADSLEELIKLYRALLKVVRSEKEILISTNLDKLSDNNKVKEELLLKIRNSENQRIQWAKELALSEGMEPEGVRLEDFARHFQDDRGERLRNYHSVLRLLLDRVKKINQDNELLVQSALSHITGAMDAIKDSLVENKTYKKKGKVSDGKTQSGYLVSREI